MSGFYAAPWMQAKFALVVAMSGIHGWLARMVKDFAADRNSRGHKFYRVLNEVPTLLMIVIVILVTVKPGF
jgi:putative membrane protein